MVLCELPFLWPQRPESSSIAGSCVYSCRCFSKLDCMSNDVMLYGSNRQRHTQCPHVTWPVCLQSDSSSLKAMATGSGHVRPQRAGRNKVLFLHTNKIKNRSRERKQNIEFRQMHGYMWCKRRLNWFHKHDRTPFRTQWWKKLNSEKTPQPSRLDLVRYTTTLAITSIWGNYFFRNVIL